MDKSLSFTDIVGQYAQLTPVTNSHYSGHCPFCASDDADNLIVSLYSHRWICLSCGAEGDRYDFVSKAENISRAEAILMVSNHASSGPSFPHARIKPGSTSGTATQSGAPSKKTAKTPASFVTKPAEPAKAKAPSSQPGTTRENAGNKLMACFLECRNFIPSYQGAAVLDEQSRMIACDSEHPLSASLSGVGEMLAPILALAGTAFSKWGMDNTLPASLTMASEDSAIVAHKSGSADKLMLLVVQLKNPADMPVARRLISSAAIKAA